VVSELIQEYNRLIYERSKQLETVTANHPTMAPFTENLASLRRNILQSIGTVLRETTRRAEQIRARIQPLEAKIDRIPQNQRKLVQIMRQQQIKQNLFLFLLQKREEAALTVAAQVPNTRIVDRAMVGSRPISPNKPMMYLFAIGVGLFLPGGIIFLREILNKKITTEAEVIKQITAPILGRIVKSPEHGTILVNKGTRSGLAETFRLLRTNLGFVLPKAGASVILVTSSISGEGKSFIAANLASGFTLAKKKVVVVGLDMRKPRLGEIVMGSKFDNTLPGLSNYLAGKVAYEDITMPTGRERLIIIPSGPVPPNPSELLLEDRLNTLMDRLREDFDLIILDAPPVGIVSDALLLKDQIDISLFVIRLGHTLKKNMKYTNELAAAGKLPQFNIVLNGLDPKEHYGYGYGYY
jgi:capsular exopolysaccharide synthesis family protein